MLILVILIIGISIFSLTLKYTDEATGITRTGLQGLKLYLIPNFEGVTFKQFFLGNYGCYMGQLFYSISVAMGIMVAYGSYVPDKTNINKSINQIEIFDTVVAILAGLMIVPAVYVFAGTEGMSAGPGLMFISLPKVFNQMGKVGIVIGIVFLMVIFAAVSSSVSIMEAIVASIMDKFKLSRKKSAVLVTVYAVVLGIIVCRWIKRILLRTKASNGAVSQILDIFDYVSNNILMPVVAILTCIFYQLGSKPKTVIDEVTKNGEKFGRKYIYIGMVKVVAPVLLAILLLPSTRCILKLHKK